MATEKLQRRGLAKQCTGESPNSSAHLAAAEQMDWIQVVLNGGPPCFHVCEDGRFCGRSERWEGHEDLHKFTSLADMVRTIAPNVRTELPSKP